MNKTSYMGKALFFILFSLSQVCSVSALDTESALARPSSADFGQDTNSFSVLDTDATFGQNHHPVLIQDTDAAFGQNTEEENH